MADRPNPSLQSLESERLDRPGIQTDGYITKKGTPSGSDYATGDAGMFNELPPGQNIEAQSKLDFNKFPVRTYKVGSVGYEGDGFDDNNGL